MEMIVKDVEYLSDDALRWVIEGIIPSIVSRGR